MIYWLARRLLGSIGLLSFILLISFALDQISPGGPFSSRDQSRSQQTRNERASNLAHLRSEYHLDLPLFYFGISSNSHYHFLDTIAIRGERVSLQNLASQSNNAEAALLLHKYLVQDLSSSSSNSGIERLLLSPGLENFKTQYFGIRSELPNATQIDSVLKLLEIQKPLWFRWPKLQFYGCKNRFHFWLFGDGDQEGILKGNFGFSLAFNKPVNQLIWPALSRTLSLAIPALALAILLGIWLGLKAGENTFSNTRLSAAFSIAFALPSFWICVLALNLLCNPDITSIFPPAWSLVHPENSGNIFSQIGLEFWRSFLPVVCWSLALFGAIGLQIQEEASNTRESLFILAARSKGVSKQRLRWRHVLPDVSPALIASLRYYIPLVLSGSIAVEVVFSVNGLGKLTLDALMARDYPLVHASVLISACFCIVSGLLADITASLIDPRLKNSTEPS